jgi:hypothetical protein
VRGDVTVGVDIERALGDGVKRVHASALPNLAKLRRVLNPAA